MEIRPEGLARIEQRIGDIMQRMARFEPQSRLDADASGESAVGLGSHSQAARSRNDAINATPTTDTDGGERAPISSPRGDLSQTPFQAELQSLIREQSQRHNMPPELVAAVVQAESSGRPGAVSPKGAVGLMQLMPGTAEMLGVDPRNPAENLDGGIRYLRDMGERFGSLDLALAAYNAGPGAVERHGGIPPYRETQNYIERVRQNLVDYIR